MKTLELPEGVAVAGGKTGTLVGAAENLMVKAFLKGRPVLVVLMQNGGDRWLLMSDLLKKALESQGNQVEGKSLTTAGQDEIAPERVSVVE